MLSFKQIEEKVQRAEKEKNKAEGALEVAMKELKEIYQCDDLESAEKLLNKLEKQEEEARKKYDTAQSKFQEVWDEQLDEG